MSMVEGHAGLAGMSAAADTDAAAAVAAALTRVSLGAREIDPLDKGREEVLPTPATYKLQAFDKKENGKEGEPAERRNSDPDTSDVGGSPSTSSSSGYSVRCQLHLLIMP